MDPLSFSVSVAALLRLRGVVLGYLNNVKDASKDRAKIAIEVSIVYSLFAVPKYRLEEADPSDLWYIGVRNLGIHYGLDLFKAALELLASKLSPGNCLRKLGRALMWTLTKTEVVDFLRRLRDSRRSSVLQWRMISCETIETTRHSYTLILPVPSPSPSRTMSLLLEIV